MRHTSLQTRHGHFQRTPQPPADSTPDKIVRFAQRAQAVAGAVQTIYAGARFAAPYVAGAVAAF